MVHRIPPALVGVPVEEREVGDPEQLPAPVGDEVRASSPPPDAAGRASSTWHRPRRDASTTRSPAPAPIASSTAAMPASPIALADDCTPSAVRRAHTRPAPPACLAISTSSSSLAARRPAGARESRSRAPCRRPTPPRGRCRTPTRRRAGRRPGSAGRSAGRACRSRRPRSPRRTACGGTAGRSSTPISRNAAASAPSTTSKTISGVANDISRSTCVNSSWRSARRASSRKQRAICT